MYDQKSWWECICRGIYPERPTKSGVSSFSSVSTTSPVSTVRTTPQKNRSGLLVYSKYDSTSTYANSIAVFNNKLAAARKAVNHIKNDAGENVLSKEQLSDILNNPNLAENLQKFAAEKSMIDIVKNIGLLDDAGLEEMYDELQYMAKSKIGRLAKEDFPDNVKKARTSVLAWGTDQSRDIAQIAMPNTKSATWSKGKKKDNPQGFRGKGTAKVVKQCYCVVGDTVTPLVRARMDIQNDSLQELGLLIQNFSDSKNIMLPKYVSQPFLHYNKKTKQDEISIYAFYPSAVCSLDAIIGSDDKALQQLKKILPEEEYKQYLDLINGDSVSIPKTILQIMQDISLGLKEIHDKGFVHQDLKAPNILLFKEDDKIRAKIADFGLTKLNNQPVLPDCSIESAAPEIFAAHLNTESGNHNYYANIYFPSYGKNLYKSYLQGDYIEPKISTSQDIFSAGIVFASLLSGVTLRNLPNIVEEIKDKFIFLQDMLKVKQTERLNADQVLEILQKFDAQQRNSRS